MDHSSGREVLGHLGFPQLKPRLDRTPTSLSASLAAPLSSASGGPQTRRAGLWGESGLVPQRGALMHG